MNSGDWNSQDSNSGDKNSGYRNSGDSNSGNWNSGDRNSGDSNSGDWNSGDSNSGDWNSGDSNSGDWNSGDWNSGYSNSGNWNSCDGESGYLNSLNPDKIRVFNQLIDKSIWEKAAKPRLLYFSLNKWICGSEMSEEEKNKNKDYKTLGGYLKSYTIKEAWEASWDEATKEDRELLFKLPNFDKEVFKEISGIDVDK